MNDGAAKRGPLLDDEQFRRLAEYGEVNHAEPGRDLYTTRDDTYAPESDLYSVKAGYADMNVQIACSMDGDLVVVGPVPIPGARHDAHDLVPYKRLPGRDLPENYKRDNALLSSVRAAVERAAAHVRS
ncbi:hypothetical protein ABZT17_02975 [Streptomyces sp. NPDC005648]|uniref:hypothetical protein n=1 Tax=Streptomyces sp. NPDC005648 TaxID=3157044 RepID=UPI0033B6C7C0